MRVLIVFSNEFCVRLIHMRSVLPIAIRNKRFGDGLQGRGAICVPYLGFWCVSVNTSPLWLMLTPAAAFLKYWLTISPARFVWRTRRQHWGIGIVYLFWWSWGNLVSNLGFECVPEEKPVSTAHRCSVPTKCFFFHESFRQCLFNL